MATSSIGKPVQLDDERARRFAKICSLPSRKAKGPQGPMKLCRDKSILDQIK